MRRPALALALLLVLGATPSTAVRAQDYRFDLADIEARPFESSGFVEARAEHFVLRPGAALFPLSFAGRAPRERLDRGSAAFELAGKARHDRLTAYARASGSAATDAYATTQTATLLEGGLRVSRDAGLSFDLGKQVQRWGKGYAWNPVAFFERPKDPNDPTSSREGFVMASADVVRSLDGPLAAVGFTAVLMPVSSDLNRDYGNAHGANVGAKLYLLYRDTDIDLLWAREGSRPQRFGIDFSRNLGPALEVHGEWSRSIAAKRRVLGTDGAITLQQRKLDSALLGLRYITEREVTIVAEWYRNGAGYDARQLSTFHELLDAAFAPGASAAARSTAQSLAQSGYGRANPGARYAYLRISAKDPFDWLYLTPALTAIVNLDDRSGQLTAELLYSGWQNVELRARAIGLHGRDGSEFGEKASGRRFELSLRLYF